MQLGRSFIGEGYYKAPNEPAHDSEMKLEYVIYLQNNMERMQIMVSENRPFGWDKMKGLADYEGTRAENVIRITTEEALSLAEWIIKSIEVMSK